MHSNAARYVEVSLALLGDIAVKRRHLDSSTVCQIGHAKGKNENKKMEEC